MNRRELVAELGRPPRHRSSARPTPRCRPSSTPITDTVASGEVVSITGFAKFARVDRPARMGRNPQTGEAINRIKASRRVRSPR